MGKALLGGKGVSAIPAVLRTPRSRWIETAAAALADGGIDAVRVEVLAARLGVSKGGFYAHFASRTQLLDELLAHWEQETINTVLDQLGDDTLDPITQIREAGALTFSDTVLPLDLAVRNWARHDPEVRERLRRADNARMDFLRSRFGRFVDDPIEIEARCILAFTLAIGAGFLAADLRGTTRADAFSAAADHVFGKPGE